MDIKAYIKDQARDLGIDAIGFTDGEAYGDIKEVLLDRRIKGYETEFEEKDIELRYSPKRVMKEVKTIIVIGLSYHFNLDKGKGSNQGRLSKSSWGIDYHTVLESKLKALAKQIEKKVNFRYKIFVDTGPLVDRVLAQKSGIGWYGKNNSIINDIYGSYIFIGTLLTDIEMTHDQPMKEQCGACQLCIKACPTNAIEEGYRINARKCISYLTQTKDKIPYELRDKMGIKLYGCDTCQLVCPKNKDIPLSQSPEFFPHKTGGSIDLKEILTLSNKGFKEKYGHMAGSWRGKNIIKRNAIIALGNIRDRNAIELLKDALQDPSPMVREYGAWALLKIDFSQGLEAVNQQIYNENNDDVRKEMEDLIDYFKDDGS